MHVNRQQGNIEWLCLMHHVMFVVTEASSSDAPVISSAVAAASVMQSRTSKDDEPTSEWSSTATLAEQIRERNVGETEARSLTERLRKEFGLENLDDSDDDHGSCYLFFASAIV